MPHDEKPPKQEALADYFLLSTMSPETEKAKKLPLHPSTSSGVPTVLHPSRKEGDVWKAGGWGKGSLTQAGRLGPACPYLNLGHRENLNQGQEGTFPASTDL